MQNTKVQSERHFRISSNTTPDKQASSSSAKRHTLPPDKGGKAYTLPPDKGGSRRVRPDGEVVDTFNLPFGHWEAKDTQDNLYIEAGKKFAAGYPSQNIVVQSPTHALLYQHGELQLNLDISEPRNLFLTIDGIPPEVFDYRLGTRSALEWVIDQYRVKTDKRSGIVNDPNRTDDPQYIVRLIGKVITVSLETGTIVAGLPVDYSC